MGAIASCGYTFSVLPSQINTRIVKLPNNLDSRDWLVLLAYTPDTLQKYADGTIAELATFQVVNGIADVEIISESLEVPISTDAAQNAAAAGFDFSPIPLVGISAPARGSLVRVKIKAPPDATTPVKMWLAIVPAQQRERVKIYDWNAFDSVSKLVQIPPFAVQWSMTTNQDLVAGGIAFNRLRTVRNDAVNTVVTD